MELSVSNINTSASVYANRLQEPRQTDMNTQAVQVGNIQPVSQQSEAALQVPSQPARRAGDITSLDGSIRAEEKYSIYASVQNALKRDVNALNDTFPAKPGDNANNQGNQTGSQGEVSVGGRLYSNAQTSGPVVQAAGVVQDGFNLSSGGERKMENTAIPEASVKNYVTSSAISGYREASMQIQQIPTIDQTV